MIHRPGRENIADPLSRLLHRRVEPDNHQRCTEEYVRFVAVSATPTALTTREIEEASADDEELKEVRKAIATGRFEKCRQYMTVAGELCVIGQLVLRGTRITSNNHPPYRQEKLISTQPRICVHPLYYLLPRKKKLT